MLAEPTVKQYDAVILYNSKDERHATRLYNALEKEGLRLWWAPEDVDYGENIFDLVGKALSVADHVLLCIGNAGLSDYLNEEAGAVFSRATRKKVKMIPVYMDGGSQFYPDNPPNPLLGGKLALDFRKRLESHKAFPRLVRQLRGRLPRGIQGPSEDVRVKESDGRLPPAPDDEIAKGISDIAKQLCSVGRGLNVGIGPHWPGKVIPSGEDVAIELLRSALKLDDKKEKLFRATPLIGPQEAALAYSLLEQLGDQAPAQLVNKFIAPRSTGEPEAFNVLARLAAAVGQRSSAHQPRAIVYTTNVDCALERAFVSNCVAFTRIVFDLEKDCFYRTEFLAAARRGQQRVLRYNGRDFAERSEEGLPEDERARYEADYQGTSKLVDIEDYIRARELNKIIQEYHERAGETKRKLTGNEPAERPILVKLLGSHQVGQTANMSCERHFRLARMAERVSVPFATALAENVNLLAGYCLCDPVFRLLFEVVLRGVFLTVQHDYRFALLPLTDEKMEGHGAIRHAVNAKVAGKTLTEFQMTLLAGVDPARFLEDLRDAVEAQNESVWR